MHQNKDDWNRLKCGVIANLENCIWTDKVKNKLQKFLERLRGKTEFIENLTKRRDRFVRHIWSTHRISSYGN